MGGIYGEVLYPSNAQGFSIQCLSLVFSSVRSVDYFLFKCVLIVPSISLGCTLVNIHLINKMKKWNGYLAILW
jgi:hypothetical protein